MPANLLLHASSFSCTRDQRVLFTLQEFSLSAGECVELRGANGSGKTTLLRALAGLFPYSGDIGTQAKTTFVGHRNGNSGLLTAAENLRWHAGLAGIEAGDALVLDVLGQMGLLRAAGRLAQQLSQGQQRRLALARLLIGDSPLWLLDEPFTALDAGGVALIDELLGRHCAAGGAALVASHVPLRIASRVLVLGGEGADLDAAA